MKKLVYLLFATVLFCSCEKDNLPEQPMYGGTASGELPEVIYATVADNDCDTIKTRTFVDGQYVLWHNGDAIAYIGPTTHRAKYQNVQQDGVASAEFTLAKTNDNVPIEADMPQIPYAVYPYSSNAYYESSVDALILTFPTEQSYAANSFGRDANVMVAAGESADDTDFHFRSVCGYLVIKLYGEDVIVKNVELTALGGEKIAGNGLITACHTAAPTAKMTEDSFSSITLNCGDGVVLGADAAHATEFWFAIPETTFRNGIKITATDINGNVFIKQTKNTVNITRNDIQPMAALQFVSNAPAATKLWYTRADEETTPLEFYEENNIPFDAGIISHKWDNNMNRFVIEFNAPLTTIKAYAFRETALATIILPESVTTIEKEAFRETPLTEITIPGSVNTIGIDAFYDCENLTSVTFNPSKTEAPLKIGYTISSSNADGPFYYSPLKTINIDRALVLTDDDGDPVIPNDWAEGLFANQYYDDDEYLNHGVSVTLGEHVKTLSDYMFNWLPIKTLTIPGTLTAIGNNVFNGCTKLTSLTFEQSENALEIKGQDDEDGPFYDSPLTTINYNRNFVYKKVNGVEFIPEDDTDGIFAISADAKNAATASTVNIGSLIQTIPDRIFCNLPITELTIPGTVTTIGNNVFNGCTELANLRFERGIISSKLTIGYNTDGEEDGPFLDSPLTNVYLNRELIYTLASGDLDADDEGIFSKRTALTSVTLGDQVRTLSNYMFSGSGITSLTIPGTVTTIGDDVFNGCTKLTSLTFEPSPTKTALTIGYNTEGEEDGPFLDSPLTSVNLNRELDYTLASGDLDAYDEGVFSERTTLTSVTFGEQVRTLSDYMFFGSGITSLTIPGTVTTIGRNVFHDCNALTSAIISTPTLGKNMFYSCDNLATVTIDGELDAINKDAFFGCYKLNTLDISGSVNTIGERAFYDFNITSLNISGHVGTIDRNAFYDNDSMTSFTVTNTGSVGTIGDFAFSQCHALTSLTIPSTVTNIGYNVFEQCYGLTSATISTSMLGYNMFINCENLATVTIDGTMDAINVDAFKGCSNLSTLNISGSVNTISDGAFDGYKLTSLNISGHVGTIGANAFDDNDNMSSFTVSGSVGTIGVSAFEDSDNLSTVNITGTVNKVCSYAFSDCDAITNLSIPANTVEDYAYEDMDGLKTAKLYGATVGKYVFYDCNSLQTLVIDGGVNKIGNNAFDQCYSLSSVTFESGSQDLHIGFQDHSSDVGAFFDSPLTYIYLDRELVDDNDDLDSWDEGIFATENYDDDDPIVTVTLGNNVKTISPWMFSGVRMEKLEIPNSVTYIGDEAFSYCYILREVSCRNTTAPTLGKDVFLNDRDKHNNNLLIKVPYISGNEYRSKWSQYDHIIWGTYET